MAWQLQGKNPLPTSKSRRAIQLTINEYHRYITRRYLKSRHLLQAVRDNLGCHDRLEDQLQLAGKIHNRQVHLEEMM